MLEDMTRKMDDTQQDYLNSKINYSVHSDKSANILKAISKPNLEEIENARDMIFPKKEARMKFEMPYSKNIDIDAISRNMAKIKLNNITENNLTHKQSTENLFSSKSIVGKQSIHAAAHEYNSDDDNELIQTIVPNTCNKTQDKSTDVVRPAFKENDKIKMKVAAFEKYLQDHDNLQISRNIEKRRKKKYFQDMKSSIDDDAADICANYNIESFGSYKNFKEHNDIDDLEDCTNQKSGNYPCTNDASNNMQIISDNTIEGNDKIVENTELYEEDALVTKTADVKSSCASRQSNVANYQDNAFTKLELNANLKANHLSKEELLKFLKRSEFLKKEFLL